MNIIRSIVANGILPIAVSKNRPAVQQLRMLRKLMAKAHNTAFGKEYDFIGILNSEDLVRSYQQGVPVHDYLSIRKWWERCFNGEKSVCWPGKIPYFALSSGTTDQATKYIPVSNEMKKVLIRSSIRQVLHIARCKNVPAETLAKHSLMIGGSTDLTYNGTNYTGDLSGITTGNVPFWFEPFSKPDMDTRKKRNWQEKIAQIVAEAPNWDVGMVAGVPAWVQIIFEEIIKKYQLKTIHDIWPNLRVYIHGGVALEPYKKSLEKLFAKEVYFFETYLASEGFIGMQTRDPADGMRLMLRSGIFYEFIPFNDKNFTDEGELKENPEVLWLDQVKEGEEYALLITTCSGAWRYMIGDTIRFVNRKKCEIKITGRTKHFLSLCGEHLSVDNMNMAVSRLAEEFGTSINEFTVAGIPYQGLFAHHWFLGVAENVDKNRMKQRLDEILNGLNEDYGIERKHALKEILLDIVPPETFLNFLRAKGKEGGQNKFPRVIRNPQYEDWKAFALPAEKSASTV